MRYPLLGAIMITLAAPPLAAQDRAVIRTSGTGEITLAPDWASVTLAVASRAATASEAARANARTVAAVWDAIARAGVPRDSVKSMSSGVQPVIDYEQERRIVGYVAETSLHVPVRDLERLGALIDAALAAGATELRGVQPRSTREDAVRAEVLTQAVVAARADAETLAAAAGGRLAGLIELATTGEGAMPVPRLEMLQARAQDAGPALSDLVIRGSVTAVWRYRPGRG